jgi:hypothetical protein
MDRATVIPLRVGAWCVDPRSGQISRDGEFVRVVQDDIAREVAQELQAAIH